MVWNKKKGDLIQPFPSFGDIVSKILIDCLFGEKSTRHYIWVVIFFLIFKSSLAMLKNLEIMLINDQIDIQWI